MGEMLCRLSEGGGPNSVLKSPLVSYLPIPKCKYTKRKNYDEAMLFDFFLHSSYHFHAILNQKILTPNKTRRPEIEAMDGERYTMFGC